MIVKLIRDEQGDEAAENAVKTRKNVRVVERLVKAAKHALEQPEFNTPRADGIGWRRAPAWTELHVALRDVEQFTRLGGGKR
jgi:hypothetical protein